MKNIIFIPAIDAGRGRHHYIKTLTHYYEFSKIFFESRKKSKQFLDFDEELRGV